MKMLSWLGQNWSVVIGLIALIYVTIFAVKTFLKLPTKIQVVHIKKCLLGWVIKAERELGENTGKIKLSTVYGWFITSFPIISHFVSFETFSKWVDESLDTMRNMIEENEEVKALLQEKATKIKEG